MKSHLGSALCLVMAAVASPALADGDAADYRIEARIVREGRLLATPVVAAVAHEPTSVTLPASQDRTLEFWAVVKPSKKQPGCYKIMVKVTLKGGASRYVWDTDVARMCGDETRALEHDGFHTTIRVQPERAPAARSSPQ